jgi:plastocyanin
MRKFRIMVCVSAMTVLLTTALVAPPGAGADDGKGEGKGGESKRVRILDDCDPATFNANLGEGACVGDGETTFDDAGAELQATGAVEDWQFKPGDFHVDQGDHIKAVNKGGEFHTFTEVAAFGGGCVPELNGPGVDPVPECADPLVFGRTGVVPGGTLHVHALDPGTHKYECLIHPWMRAVVDVRADDGDHHGHNHG